MRKLLFAAAAAGTLVVAAPASAQVYFGAGPGGVGVEVGPFGFGAGPWYDRHHWRDGYAYGPDGYYAYGADCPLVRQRIVTADGRVIFRTQRSCD